MQAKAKKATTLSQAMAKQAAVKSGFPSKTEPAREQPASARGRGHAFTFHGGGPVGPAGPASASRPAPAAKKSTLKSLKSAASDGNPGGGAGAGRRVSLPEDPAEGLVPPIDSRPTISPVEAARIRAATARSPPRQRSAVGSPSKARTSPALDNSPAADSNQSTASPTSPWLRRQQSPNPYSDQAEADAVRSNMKSMKTLGTTTTALTPALGPKNSFFGSSERMEPTKWKRWANMVDKQTLGGHYQYIVGELSAAHAVENLEQKEHDEMVADGLHKKRLEDPAHPRAGSPKPPAAVAFSDRAARLREGRGARAAMMPQDGPLLTERGDHVNCSCPVCCPFDAKAAGQPSHDVHHNKVPRCAKNGHPSVPQWEPGTSLTLHSYRLARSMPHLEGNPMELPAEEERGFHQNMGRKAKAPLPTSAGSGSMLLHKSFSVDDMHVPCAGSYNQELGAEISLQRSLRRQAWQGSAGELPQRHGAALALSPTGSDPPAPSQICNAKRAPGDCKHDDFSAQSKYTTTYFNQEVHRFADSGLPRGRSQPPPRPDRATAGVGTGEWGNHMWNKGNPVTMQGKDQTLRALGNTSRPRGNLTHRANAGNRSGLISRVINHDVGNQYFAMETAWRMQNDPDFATLCTLSQDTMQWGKTVAESIKNRNGHADSSYIRANLQWIEE